jgi:hypothetical protein
VNKCCNGCDKPVQKPSKVLCADCLDALDRKMQALLGPPKKEPRRG